MARKKTLPHTVYREPFYRRALYFGFGSLLMAISIGGGVAMVTAGTGREAGETYLPGVFVALTLFGGMLLVATSLHYRLILTSRSLMVRRAFGTLSMARRDIAGFRKVSGRGNSHDFLRLYVHGKRSPAMRLALAFEDNEGVMKWFDGIPCLP
jgi:hypothetical protein